MNEKAKGWLTIFLGVVFSFCIGMLSNAICGCASNRRDAIDIVGANSYYAGKLEATVASLDGTVSASRKRIGDVIEASRGITDGIARLEYLFGEYEKEVGRILGEVEQIRANACAQSQDDFYRFYSFDCGDFGSFCLASLKSQVQN